MTELFKTLNASDILPFYVYRQEQANGQPCWKIRGPGCSEVYPWPSHDAAHTEAKRLRFEHQRARDTRLVAMA